jgi:hypothetical protein
MHVTMSVAAGPVASLRRSDETKSLLRGTIVRLRA